MLQSSMELRKSTFLQQKYGLQIYDYTICKDIRPYPAVFFPSVSFYSTFGGDLYLPEGLISSLISYSILEKDQISYNVP